MVKATNLNAYGFCNSFYWIYVNNTVSGHLWIKSENQT